MIASMRDEREQGDPRDKRDLGDPRMPGDKRDLGDPRDVPPEVIRSKGEMRARQVAYAFMTALLTLSLFVALAAVYQLYFTFPPIQIESLDQPMTRPLCPGDRFDITNEVTVEEPSVLYFVVSVMDEGANANIPGTQFALQPRTHPHPTTFRQIIPWHVPTLPPGKYTRVMGAQGPDGDEHAVFLQMPFEVGENCAL